VIFAPLEMPAAPWIRWTLLTLALLAFILVPFVLFQTPINAWTEQFLESGRSKPLAAAVLAALLAGDVLLPVPSSLVSTAAGYLLGFVPAAVVSWTGMTAGCGLGYLAGSWAGGASAGRFVSESNLARVAAARERHGDWMLVLFRAVPVLAEASVIFAGFIRMPAGRFFAVTTPANLGISVAYAAVGAFAVDANSFLLAFAGAILLPAIFLGLVHLLRA
jgi:membrane protein DedA with SNARE-associated domain